MVCGYVGCSKRDLRRRGTGKSGLFQCASTGPVPFIFVGADACRVDVLFLAPRVGIAEGNSFSEVLALQNTYSDFNAIVGEDQGGVRCGELGSGHCECCFFEDMNLLDGGFAIVDLVNFEIGQRRVWCRVKLCVDSARL